MPRPTRETAFQFLDFNPYRDLNTVILGPAFLDSVVMGDMDVELPEGLFLLSQGSCGAISLSPRTKDPRVKFSPVLRRLNRASL